MLEEFKINLEIVFQRIFELLLLSIGLSAICTVLNVFGVITLRYQVLLLLFFFSLFFLICNIISVKNSYFEFFHNIRLCYNINLTAYVIFGMINASVYLIFPKTVYTWMFSIMKFMRYSPFALSTVYSAVVFHFLNLLAILITPLVLKWIFTDRIPISEEGELPPIPPSFDYDDDEEDDF